MRWFGRCVVVLVFLSVFCASARAADKQPFTLTILGPVIRGDEISVEAELKNTSDRPAYVIWGSAYEVVLHDAAGKLVPKKAGLMGYGGSAESVPLQPAQSSGQKVFISGPHSEYVLSKPGKYIVYLRRGLDDAGYPHTFVTSNKLMITIHPKKWIGYRLGDIVARDCGHSCWQGWVQGLFPGLVTEPLPKIQPERSVYKYTEFS